MSWVNAEYWQYLDSLQSRDGKVAAAVLHAAPSLAGAGSITTDAELIESSINGHEPGCGCARCEAVIAALTRIGGEQAAQNEYLAQLETRVKALFPPSSEKIMAAISEPLGLPGASLPAYGIPSDGCCRECLRPPVYSLGLCVYCGELSRARDEDGACRDSARQDIRDRNLGRTVVTMLLLTLGMLAVLWASGVIT